MVAWVVVVGIVALVLILVGAVLVVLVATRERARPVNVPLLSRILNAGERVGDGQGDGDRPHGGP